MIISDQMGRTIELSASPKRIISLVPSQTELLYYLGLEEQVVGITKFCVHPEQWFRTKVRVGGTKQVKFEQIEALQPDLIIGNKEENSQKDIEELAKDYPVWMSDIVSLEDSFEMMLQLGVLTNRAEKANDLVAKLQADFNRLKERKSPPRVAYFIWQNPWMVAASGTFIDELLQAAGFQNAFAQLSRYPEVTEQQIQQANPDLIFLSSEPFPFKEKQVRQFEELFPQTKTQIVDGELFSWYGSRLLESAAYFEELWKQIE